MVTMVIFNKAVCERQEMKEMRNIPTSSHPTDGSCAAGLIVESDRRDTRCWGVAGMINFFIMLNVLKVHLFACTPYGTT